MTDDSIKEALLALERAKESPMDAGTLIVAKSKVSAILIKHNHPSVSSLVGLAIQYLKDAEKFKSPRKKLELIESADERIRYRIEKILHELSSQLGDA